MLDVLMEGKEGRHDENIAKAMENGLRLTKTPESMESLEKRGTKFRFYSTFTTTETYNVIMTKQCKLYCKQTHICTTCHYYS